MSAKTIDHKISSLQNNINNPLRNIHTSKYESIWIELYWLYDDVTEDIYTNE